MDRRGLRIAQDLYLGSMIGFGIGALGFLVAAILTIMGVCIRC